MALNLTIKMPRAAVLSIMSECFSQNSIITLPKLLAALRIYNNNDKTD
jgi:hypothetical protein